jgi:SAM-dependent methyltransferase
MTNDTPQETGHLVSEIDKRAFIAYYNQHSIIPVSQDISDPDFIFKRASLYKLLGIPLPSLRNKSILELGPGGGFNAIAITHFGPENYVFVDATKASLLELNRKKSAGLFGGVNVEIIDSNIFDYADSRVFDLVVIEGVVPGQTKPSEMLQHAGSFVSLNGSLITTTTTATSLLSDVCRRLFRPFVIGNRAFFDEQVELAEKIFDSHLKSLGTKTRPTRDWVLDNILHKWENGARFIFSMIDSSRSLGPSFDFNGSSPKFLIDDRFYKKIDRSAHTSNDLLIQQFSNLSLALLDYRVSLLDILRSTKSTDLEELCVELFEISVDIIEDNSYRKLDAFLALLKEVDEALPDVSRPTSLAIKEFIRKFPEVIERNATTDFPNFSHWWGRGQQYASFTRVA